MIRNLLLSAALLLCVFCKVFAQVIPDSLRVDWTHAGYDGTIPDPALILNVKNFGAYGDGTHDDAAAILNAISSTTNLKVIYFPAGTYLIKSSLSIPDNTVLRGAGVSSVLSFNLSQSSEKKCLIITSIQKNNYTPVISGYAKGSNVLHLANTNGFAAGQYAELHEANGSFDTISPGTYRVGQFLKIISVSSNTLTFSSALRINYIASLHPEIRVVTPKKNVGIECMKITRTDAVSGDADATIQYSYVNNCWIKGVEGYKCQEAHVSISYGSHVTVSGCYMHDAFDYGSGGEGYGINLVNHTCDCKIENCIFGNLRHSMVVMSGSNGNVYAYNYSFNPESTTEIPRDNIGDIDLHGHYPFSNLFEGNIAQNIFIDDYWGPSGPYNTFFRNRAELYGIEIQNQYHYNVLSDKQNAVGNEVTNTGTGKGNFSFAGNSHFMYANNIKGVAEPAGSSTLADKSYYLTAQPYYWNIADSWPSIGYSNMLNAGSNPAKKRYQSGSSFTSCTKEQGRLSVIVSSDSIFCSGNKISVTVTASGGTAPYTGAGTFSKAAGFYKFIVADAAGKKDTGTITISETAALGASAKVTKLTCKNSDDGRIMITAKNGASPFLYSIDSVKFSSKNSFKNLSSGNYKVCVKDLSNCISETLTTLKNPKTACFAAGEFSDEKKINGNNLFSIYIYPNPSAEIFNLQIENAKTYLKIFVTDVYGRMIFSAGSSSDKIISFGKNFSAGIYFVTIINGNETKVLKIMKN